MDYTVLNNGIEMPMQGFGVYQISHADLCQQVVTEALGAGYRLIDTASVYGNEEAVGAAVRQSGVMLCGLFVADMSCLFGEYWWGIFWFFP